MPRGSAGREFAHFVVLPKVYPRNAARAGRLLFGGISVVFRSISYEWNPEVSPPKCKEMELTSVCFTNSFSTKCRSTFRVLLGISSVALMLFDEIFVSKSVFETNCVLPPPEWDETFVYRTNALSTKCASFSSPKSHFVYEMRARMSFRIRMEIPRDEMQEDENFVDEMPPRRP